MTYLFEDREPDFVNEKGVKWWLDKAISDYAQKADQNGIKVDATGFVIEMQNGFRSYVLLSKGGKILSDDQKLEAIYCKIDILKLAEKYDRQDA